MDPCALLGLLRGTFESELLATFHQLYDAYSAFIYGRAKLSTAQEVPEDDAIHFDPEGWMFKLNPWSKAPADTQACHRTRVGKGDNSGNDECVNRDDPLGFE